MTTYSLSELKMKRSVQTVSLFVLMGLAGCQAIGLGKKSNPPLTTPPQSIASNSVPEEPVKPENQPLHQVNTERLNLTDAVGIAIARHPDIGRAAAVVVQSNAQIAVEKSAWYPTFQYGIDPGYVRYSSSNTKSDTVRGSISANQLIYDFGRTSSRIGSARATYERDQHLLADSIEQVAVNVAAIYIELAASQELVKAADREYGALRRTRDKIAERVQSGLSDSADMTQADLAIQRARADKLAAQTRFDVAAGRFAEITGIRPKQVVSLDETAKFIGHLGAGSNDIDNTPAVMAADAEVKASLERVKLARSQYYPDVTLQASQMKSTGAKNVANDSSFVGLQMSGSLNAGLREKYQVAAAQAELNAAKQTSENQRLVTRTTLGSAETEAAGANDRMGNSRQLMSLSMTARDLYWQQYTLNKRPLTDVVSAERDTFSAESEYISAISDHMYARIKAYSAVGELVDRLRSQQ